MARTTITAQTPVGPFPSSVAANALDYTYTAADVALGNQFAFTGRELLLVHNSDGASARNLTLTAKADPFGATGTVTSYSVGIGEDAIFSFLGGANRWRQSDGFVYVNGDNANLKFAVILIS